MVVRCAPAAAPRRSDARRYFLVSKNGPTLMIRLTAVSANGATLMIRLAAVPANGATLMIRLTAVPPNGATLMIRLTAVPANGATLMIHLTAVPANGTTQRLHSFLRLLGICLCACVPACAVSHVTALCRRGALGRTQQARSQAPGDGGQASPQGAGDAQGPREPPGEALQRVPEQGLREAAQLGSRGERAVDELHAHVGVLGERRVSFPPLLRGGQSCLRNAALRGSPGLATTSQGPGTKHVSGRIGGERGNENGRSCPSAWSCLVLCPKAIRPEDFEAGTASHALVVVTMCLRKTISFCVSYLAGIFLSLERGNAGAMAYKVAHFIVFFQVKGALNDHEGDHEG